MGKWCFKMTKKKREGSITTLIKPDIEQQKAVFHIPILLTEIMDIIAGEMMYVTVKGDKIIIERVDWKPKSD